MLGLCERFGCLPSQLEREDARILRLVEIETLGGRRVPEPADPYEDPSSVWADLHDKLAELRDSML